MNFHETLESTHCPAAASPLTAAGLAASSGSYSHRAESRPGPAPGLPIPDCRPLTRSGIARADSLLRRGMCRPFHEIPDRTAAPVALAQTSGDLPDAKSAASSECCSIRSFHDRSPGAVRGTGFQACVSLSRTAAPHSVDLRGATRSGSTCYDPCNNNNRSRFSSAFGTAYGGFRPEGPLAGPPRYAPIQRGFCSA